MDWVAFSNGMNLLAESGGQDIPLPSILFAIVMGIGILAMGIGGALKFFDGGK